MYDYIVVGQGIAGTMLTWFLQKHGQRVLVIDKYDAESSSRVAAGMLNPITGRRFVKTWLADELFPFAAQTYREMEQALQQTFLHPVPVYKLLHSNEAINDWSARCATAAYRQFLQNESLVQLDEKRIKSTRSAFEISGAYRVNTGVLLSSFRKKLESENNLLDETFKPEEWLIDGDGISRGNVQAAKLVFCNGASGVSAAFFNHTPFRYTKGECLQIEIENFYADAVINGDITIIPESADTYWAGATMQQKFSDTGPTPEAGQELQETLDATLAAGYTVKAHRAAVRPSVKDRRPLIGTSPLNPRVLLFNGMGTKGYSLSPYLAHHFVQHLLYNIPLLPEVSISRFLPAVGE